MIISSRLRLATTRSVLLSILSILYVLCRGFVGCWTLDCLVVIGDFVVEGILNVLPGLSLFTLVFIFIFAVCLMGSCDFCLSFMPFGGWIGDLCNGCFDGDFALLVVRVGVIDVFCLDYNIGSLAIRNLVLGKIQPSVVFSGTPETLANHWLPTWWISPWVFYICCRHWFYLQQRRSCFLPYSSLQFS